MKNKLKNKIKEKLKNKTVLLTAVLIGLAFLQVMVTILQVAIMLIKLK